MHWPSPVRGKLTNLDTLRNFARVKRALIILFAALLGSSGAWADPGDQLAVTRFSGLPNSKLAATSILTRERGVWIEGPQRAIGSGGLFKKSGPVGLGCFTGLMDSLFAQQQISALSRYVELGYMTREEARDLLESSLQFTDRPIAFYNLLTQKKPTSGLFALSDESDHFIQYQVSGKNLEAGGYLSASLYSVGGQRLKLTKAGTFPEVEFMDLPWTRDPDFKEAAKHLFSREKYPLAWELGRATTTDPHEFSSLLAIAGQDIAIESLHYGVPSADYLDKAYVTAKFLTAENSEKFEKLFKDHLFLRAPNNPGKTVFVVPLKKYLEKFPLRRYESSQQLAFESKLGKDEAQIQHLLESIKYAHNQSLDLRYKGLNQESPIMFSSSAAGATMIPVEVLLQSTGVTEEAFKKFLKASNSMIRGRANSLDVPWPKKLLDPAASHQLKGKWQGFPLQISNLDPVLSKTDPNYLPSVIVGSFDHYARQFALSNGGVEVADLQRFVKELNANQAHFVVTTQYPETAQALKKLMPKAEKVIDLSGDVHSGLVWESIAIESEGKLQRPSQKLYSYSFDLAQVGQMRYYVYHLNGMNADKLPFVRPGYHWWLQGVSEP